MDLANPSNRSPNGNGVRIAEKSDVDQIMRLLRKAPYTHIHADWHVPGDWMGTPGFVVQSFSAAEGFSKSSFASRFLPPRSRIRACLAVSADPPPAAWVRVASIAEIEDPCAALADMLGPVREHLRELEVTVLGWLVVGNWPYSWLTDVGFAPISQIETYVKDDLTVPQVQAVPGLSIRPVHDQDLDLLAEIESEAFAPLWRHSARSLRLARQQSIGFDVALQHERIVGYQLSTRSYSSAHLVRLTVAPELHGKGIGSTLLAHAIEQYQKLGLRQVSLNTQVDNVASQRLYNRFAFNSFGQRVPVWALVP